MADQLSEEKYLVFKTEELIQLFGKYGLPTGNQDCAPVAERILTDIEAKRVPDAVVIRKQDMFAGPALHMYAHAISMSVRMISDPDEADRLQSIADYFHEQALDADASAKKLPD